ncbi:MAG: TlyA family RNA methyltransferase [Devosia sp.]
MAERIRLDIALEARGLAQSRARARDAVLRGTVTVNGAVAAKPAMLVDGGDRIDIHDPAQSYVSRSALKLIAGLDAGGIAVAGRVCLDVGASTGGFTQVLVERGAARVYAVDVGHGQIATRVRALGGVISLEGTDARMLTRALVPEPVDLLVCDVSFVSATKVLEPALGLCAQGADAVLLVKPQFEAGRERLGKGGIVSDPDAIASAEAQVVAFMVDRGWTHLVSVPSPIAGGDGNTEIVAVFHRA